MTYARTLAIAAALMAAATVSATAQGYGAGGGWGRGGGWAPGMGPGSCTRTSPDRCWRVANPERHATCRKDADTRGLRAGPRRSFMQECMTK